MRPGVSLRAVRLFTRKSEMVRPDDALPGHQDAISELEVHRVLGTPIVPPFPDGSETAIFGMGCFWGADRPF